MFSLRIVTTDHYLATPFPGLDVTRSEFRGTEVKKVPVLRIFGSTPAGQKTCMHVHGVFPYLYVPFDGTRPEERYLKQFASSLDKALNVGNGMAKANFQHVFKISLVSGIPMYGYHHKEEAFMKIYLYNPHSIKKAADLLLGGAVMNKSFQPHESHIPYQLQLFIDFNLYGMNMINVAAVKFRHRKNNEDEREEEVSNTPDSVSSDSLLENSTINTPTSRRWFPYNTNRDLYLGEDVERHSTCELEVDVVASDVLNRLKVDANIGTNPGLAALWEDERQRRRDRGEDSQLEPQDSQEHDEVVISESERELKERLREIIGEQRGFQESESDEELDLSRSDDGGTQSEIIPSSQTAQHILTRQDSDDLPSSQDTIIVEGGRANDDNQPIISLESIQKVLSFSQSFSQPSASQTDKGEKSLLEILASLAEDSPDCSQHDVSQIESLEDEDSIMVEKPHLPTHLSIKEDEEETIEMTQIIVPSEEEEEEEKKDDRSEYDLDGMDVTWSASQWFSDNDSDDDPIPQFDGASDPMVPKRPVGRPRKRLGPRGPLIQDNNQMSRNSPQFSNMYQHQNQQYASYHGNNEYHQVQPQYNNQWPGDYNTHHNTSQYTQQGSRWEQQHNYEPINSPPAYHQGRPSSDYYPGYNQQQQQMYQRFPSDMAQSSGYPSHNQTNFQPTSPHSVPLHQNHNSTLSQNHTSTHQHQSSNLSATSVNHRPNFPMENQSPFSPVENQSAFFSGVTNYQYEAITPPPVQQTPESPTVTPPVQSPLRNILTNPGKAYNPSYMSNRSVSRSSTHSTSSSGSLQSDLIVAKPDDMFSGNSSFQSQPQLNFPQSYPERFGNPGMDSVRSYQNSQPPFVNQMPQHRHPGIQRQTSHGHQGPLSPTSPKSVIHHYQSSSSQPPFNSFNHGSQENRLTSPPVTFPDSYSRTMNSSLEDLFSDEASFPGFNNSPVVDESSSKKAKDELKRLLSGDIDAVESTISDDFHGFHVSPIKSPKLPSFTEMKSLPVSSPSKSNFNQNSNYGKKPIQDRNALDSLFNLVSNVSKEKIVGLSPKKAYTNAFKAANTVVTSTAMAKKPHSLPPSSEPQYTNMDSWKDAHSKLDLSLPPMSYEETQIPVWNNLEDFKPLPKVGKQQRMKKLGLIKQKGKGKTLAVTSAETTKNTAYSFTFQVPTPVFKRLKFRSPPKFDSGLKIVRLHPKDARKYSLLKIGRETVKIPKLSADDVLKIQRLLQYGDMEREIRKIANVEEPVPKPVVQNIVDDAKKAEGKDILSQLLAEAEDPSVKLIGGPAAPPKKVNNRTEEIRALKRKSLKLNKKPKLLTAKNPVHFNNMSLEADYSHRIIDPDQGEEKMVVLRDVSLRDASEGHLTPIKSQTPVSGRSPAYCSSSTVISEDIYNKSIEELELSSTHKIFSNVLLCDKEPLSEGESVLSNTLSGTSSRSSSRKESSDSSESLFEEQEKHQSIGKRRHSSAHSQTSSRCGNSSRRSSLNSQMGFPAAPGTNNEGSKSLKNHKKKRHKFEEKEGVHYIVVGKFKGHKSMKVKLKRVNCQRPSVSATEFLTNPDKFQNGMIEIAAEGQEINMSSCEVTDEEEFPKEKSYSAQQYESSDSCNSYDSGMMSRSENPSLNVSEVSDDGMEISENSKMNKTKRKKQKLTRNQRLGVAFLTTKARRKKTPNGGKLMNSLSLLHQATLANLTETPPTYSDEADDHKTNYEDVMMKLALFSPPESEKCDSSPPNPLSPTETVKDVCPIKAKDLLTGASPEYETETTPNEVDGKCMQPLEIDVNSKPVLRPQGSFEGLYETPLSSLDISKADPQYSPGHASVGSSENDFNTGMPELKDETAHMDVEEDNDDFWKDDRFSKTSQQPKTAVVKLAPLSFSDISNAVVQNSSSPPDLGPPNIPNFSGVLSISNEKSPPPPNLTPNRSPRTCDTDGKDGKANEIEVLKLMAYRPKSILAKRSPNSHSASSTSPNAHYSSASYEGDWNQNSSKMSKLPEIVIETASQNEKSTEISNIPLEMERENNADMNSLKDVDFPNPDDIDLNPKIHEHSKTVLKTAKVTSYLSAPSKFVASNTNSEKPPMTSRNLWTDISCASIDNIGDTKPQKYKKKHEMYNNSQHNHTENPSDNIPEKLRKDSNSDKNITPTKIDNMDSVTLNSIVIKPTNLAPLRSSIIESAQSHGLTLTNHQEAFFSNPDDIPERSRQVGGQVLKIDSNSLQDMPEFQTTFESLKTWRTIFTANSSEKLFSSQERESLWDKLEKDPQFRFILSEDKKQIIAPCHMPPSKSNVKKWLKDKLGKVLDNNNIMTKILDIDEVEPKKEKIEIVDRSNSREEDSDTKIEILFPPCDNFVEVSTSEPMYLDQGKGNSVCLGQGKNNSVCVNERKDNSLCVNDKKDNYANTNKRKDNSVESDNLGVDNSKCESVYEYSTVVEISENESSINDDNSFDCAEIEILSQENNQNELNSPNVDSEPSKSIKVTRLKRTLSDGEILDTSREDLEIVSPPNPAKKYCSRWDQEEMSPSKSNKVDFGESDSYLHSTPVSRKTNCKDLFEPSCTPIIINRDKQTTGDGNIPGMFVTPKRPAPPRRQSTNKENTLRRSILTSQMKSQLLTPDMSKEKNSQIDGPTPKNSFGFKITQQNLQTAKALHQHQYLTVMSIEIHAETRGELSPNPEMDPIQVIFYSVYNDVPESEGPRITTGAIIVDKTSVPEERQTPKRTPGKGRKRKASGKSRSVSPKPMSRSPQPSTSKAGTSRSSPPRARSLSPRPIKDSPSASKISPKKRLFSSSQASSKKVKPSSPQPSTSKEDITTPRSRRSRKDNTSKRQEAKASTSKDRSPSPKASTSKAKSASSPQPSTSKASSQTLNSKPSTSKAPSQSPKSTPGSSQEKTTPHKPTLLEKSGIDNLVVTYVSDEQELLDEFIQLVHRWDPDVMVGFEIQLLSLGYILQRAAHLSLNICSSLSRLPGTKDGNRFSAEKDTWGADYNTEIHIAGRIVLNLWRVLKHEITLNIYDFENVAYHVLHRRIPLYSFKSLSTWFNHRTHLYRWRVIDHYITRVKGLLQIIDQLDIIGKTSEFARVFGIEFYDVLSRGSQYRVESMMLRLAKPMNYIPVSPSVHQRARMRAPECIPLTLEPESKFYTNPVVVLDFQSLYPSIMIAYNYCFSTCMGRLGLLAKAPEGQYEFGCTSLRQSPFVVRKLEDDITISPNGCCFVNQDVRKGIISRMVEEILNTRIMVKKAMKSYKDDKALYRMLYARQLGLKLIANVTYGYTAANFSGRMPCIEVGDSIVRKARESLERSIKLVEDTPRWGARVVYGDTDSLFIEMKGKSKDEAFVIGQEIADTISNMFPKPMKLKFEKVYLPCVLQTKKRYVGFMYETRDQIEPVFDAKGIETVRRDNCGAVAKILERCIKILFTSKDVSQVKQFVIRQCQKLLEGKVSLQDCVFAKEYRGMAGYKPGACVPALQIARKRIKFDARSEPRTGERVPYIIVYGTPGLPLIQLVREPRDLINDPSLRLNSTYYITKQILPPLNRLFSLLGVDVFMWYNEMPKIIRIVPQSVTGADSKKGTISQYFATSNCPVCEEQTKQVICKKCMNDPQTTTVVLSSRIQHWEQVHSKLTQVCYTCMGCQDIKQPCITLDCPILFRRLQASQDNLRGDKLRQDMTKMFDF